MPQRGVQPGSDTIRLAAEFLAAPRAEAEWRPGTPSGVIAGTVLPSLERDRPFGYHRNERSDTG